MVQYEIWGNNEFNIGDLSLKLDKAHDEKGKHTEFQALWIGFFQVKEKISNTPTIYKPWR